MPTKELTDEQIRSMVDNLPEIKKTRVDLLLIFYVAIGDLDPKHQIKYTKYFERALLSGHWEFPEGVRVIFIPTRKGENRVQAVPIKGFLDGTIRESMADIEKMLFELQENIKLAKLLGNKE